MIMRSIRVLASAMLISAVSGLGLLAQDGVAVRGLGQAMTPSQVRLHENDVWGGAMYLTLDGAEVLVGVFSGQDGTTAWHSPRGTMGLGKGGSLTFAFNRQPDGSYRDTFTTFVTNATFPNPPGQIGFGAYQGSHKIVSGTGRFQNASGLILVSGTYVFFPLAGGTTETGYWNPDVTGHIYNVAPAQ
jgi:hypothetical protein